MQYDKAEIVEICQNIGKVEDVRMIRRNGRDTVDVIHRYNAGKFYVVKVTEVAILGFYPEANLKSLDMIGAERKENGTSNIMDLLEDMPQVVKDSQSMFDLLDLL